MHPHLVLAPIVIGIINNHKFDRLPIMVKAEVVGCAKTTMAAVVISQEFCWSQNCLLSILPVVQCPAFFTIISSPWGRNEAAKLAGSKARRLVVCSVDENGSAA